MAAVNQALGKWFPGNRGDPTEIARRARRVLWVSATITLLLYVVPFGDLLARPLLYLSTLVHELGHGTASLLVGGDFVRLEMWRDGSGVASNWIPGEGLPLALVAAGGLVGPALAAAIGFAFARRPGSSRVALAVIGGFLLWAMIFKIRGAFGLAVAGVVAGGTLWVALRATAEWAQLLLGFLSVQLALSVFSRGDYLFSDQAATGMGVAPSDTAAISQAIGGPYWMWGALCGLVSVAALVVGAWLMLRGIRRSPASAS